jgi:hypothetical protein
VRGLPFGAVRSQNRPRCNVDQQQLVRQFGGNGQAFTRRIDVDSMRAAEAAKRDLTGLLPRQDIDDGYCIAARSGMLDAHGPVIGGVDEPAIGRLCDFVRVFPDSDSHLEFARSRIESE